MELTNCVTRLALFQYTSAPETKFIPVTVSVNAPLPMTAEGGFSEVTDGSGYVTVTDAALEAPTPGVFTVTGTLPTFAASLAGIVAVSMVLLT